MFVIPSFAIKLAAITAVAWIARFVIQWWVKWKNHLVVAVLATISVEAKAGYLTVRNDRGSTVKVEVLDAIGGEPISTSYVTATAIVGPFADGVYEVQVSEDGEPRGNDAFSISEIEPIARLVVSDQGKVGVGVTGDPHPQSLLTTSALWMLVGLQCAQILFSRVRLNA